MRDDYDLVEKFNASIDINSRMRGTLHGIYNLLSWILILLIFLVVQACNISMQQSITY